MVSRSLYDVFMLMRNNALQSRHLYTSSKRSRGKRNAGTSEDRVALISDHDHGDFMGEDEEEEDRQFMAEQVGTALRYRRLQNLPPEWTETIDEVNGQIETIRKKVKELKTSHDRVIKRPAFDDDEDDTTREMEGATREITQLFHQCHARIGVISRRAQTSRSRSDRKLAENATLRLTRELQEVSADFKVAQVNYLKQLQDRQERSQLFMNTGSVGQSSQSKTASGGRNLFMDEDSDEKVLLNRGLSSTVNQSHSYQSLVQIQENATQNVEVVQARDQEIDRIVKSIEDLNSIFKDVSGLIYDQGTVLDRIDHNIEQSSVKVESAHKQLVKADRLQKSNRKMMIIFVLTLVVVFLIIILILVKLS